MRAAAIAFVAAVLLACGCTATALAQGGENAPPTELWENYPLDAPAPDHATTPGERAPRPATPDPNAAEPAPGAGATGPADDDGPGLFVLMIPPLIVTVGILFAAARQRRRGEPLRNLLPRASAERRPQLPPPPVTPEPVAEPIARLPEPPPPEPDQPDHAPAEPARPSEPQPEPVQHADPEPEPVARPEPPRVAEPVAERPTAADELAPPPAPDELHPRRLPSNRFARNRADALGYVSVPAVDDSYRDDLRSQVRRIRRACEAFELSLLELVPDDESTAATPAERPGYRRVMRRLDRGDATCLVTTRVERLSSSAEEWVLLLELLEDLDVRLIVVEDALDTHASGGREEAWALVGRDAPLAPGQP